MELSRYSFLLGGAHRVSKERLVIAYDGQALADGTMDARELAPALLAISDAIKLANEEINGERAQVSVRVSSDFRQGSFEFGIIVSQTVDSLRDLIAPLLSPQTVATADQILGYLGLVSGVSGLNVIEVIRWAKNRKIERSDRNKDGLIQLTIEGDNNTVFVLPEVERLLDLSEVRKALRDSLKPLERDGVDEFRTQHNGKVVQRIQRDELSFFDGDAEPDKTLTQFGGRVILEVASPAFPDGRKWEFKYGQERIFARISDEAFLQRVDDGKEAFRKGDYLEVDIIMRQVKKGNRIESDHEITKVHEHRSRGEQLRLFGES